jgi:hypothetical protein
LNIYFSCSITGGRQDQTIYRTITDILLSAGHTVPTAHLADIDVLDKDKLVEPQDVFIRDSTWVTDCDALVAEATTPSHGVGYEIAMALSLKKPVLCCYQKGVSVSKMLTGNILPGYHQLAYSNPHELHQGLLAFLNQLDAGSSV